jgi:hypothetical protein
LRWCTTPGPGRCGFRHCGWARTVPGRPSPARRPLSPTATYLARGPRPTARSRSTRTAPRSRP